MGSLVAEALLAVEARSPIIVDAGCGVGRVAADAARLAPGGQVIGVDASVHMLEFARQVALGTEAVPVELRDRGFEEPLLIPARSVDNLTLLRADVEQLPIAAAAVDLMLSVNVVDRLPSGPEKALAECARVLRPGGRMVFTDPPELLGRGALDEIPDLGFDPRSARGERPRADDLVRQSGVSRNAGRARVVRGVQDPRRCRDPGGVAGIGR